MEQLSLFTPCYKYIIDASSINSQKEGEPHTRRINRTLWNNIERMITEKAIITSAEIEDELQDKNIIDWFHNADFDIIEIDDIIQRNVINVVTKCSELIDFNAVCKKENKTGSSGDAFLIATAMKYGITVITEENRRSPKKIPAVCTKLGIDCINIDELSIREGWVF